MKAAASASQSPITPPRSLSDTGPLMTPTATAATASATRFTVAAGGAFHGLRWRCSAPAYQAAFLSARPRAVSLTPQRRFVAPSALYKADIQTTGEGLPETLDYRVFFLDGSGKKVSPWHDVPLHVGDGVFNFVVEIPKVSSAKMEVATDEPFTPIKQDTKKGKLRYYP
ncbi:hypothetical protein BHM03_00049807 [Ensete ventricosum]|nr:hypothetical protein BHM03_00049807 [Ensete ventricosum]